MGDVTVGLLHPGDMGAAVGQCLAGAGHRVLWAPEGRSPASAVRAEAAGLTAADGGLAGLVWQSDVIVSVCPPHAALDIARQVAGFGGVYVDANAISPVTAREVAGLVEGSAAPAMWTEGSSGLPRSSRDSSGSTSPGPGPGRSSGSSRAARSTRG